VSNAKPTNAKGKYRGVVFDSRSEALEEAMDGHDDVCCGGGGVRLGESQQCTFIVTTPAPMPVLTSVRPSVYSTKVSSG
jgi:hypothetical protein